MSNNINNNNNQNNIPPNNTITNLFNYNPIRSNIPIYNAPGNTHLNVLPNDRPRERNNIRSDQHE